ncbi:DUF106 domain-containing protein [Candidatus Bathyarchaeota archaeon]|nr:DUF106 domain-containing protein [Candidatus Bathyarchaeota archaeon]
MIEILQNIPYSTFFMLFLALVITLATSVANRLLTDPEKMKAWRKEISEWNKELREARRANDKKRIEKLMKKQQYILQLQGKMSWQTMKVSLMFFIPILIVWQALIGFYGNSQIAYFPGIGATLPIPMFGLSMIWWYMLCSFLFSTIFSHLLGLTGVE